MKRLILLLMLLAGCSHTIRYGSNEYWELRFQEIQSSVDLTEVEMDLYLMKYHPDLAEKYNVYDKYAKPHAPEP